MIHSHEFEVGGKTLSLETGRVAKQAGGSVLLGMGETVVFAAATMSHEPRPGIDFLPLTCDYEERKYAVGKIPGGFIKRGGRPSEKAILTSRLIDRPLRPLFPKGMRNDVQVIAMPFAVDQECPPDVLAVCAAGVAVHISNIPFKDAVAGVRVGRINGEFILFPSIPQINESDLDLVVAGHKGAISMVEAGSTDVTEEDMIAALKFAHDAIVKMCTEFDKFAKMVNKEKKVPSLSEVDKDIISMIQKESGKEIAATIVNPDKATRESAISDMEKDLVAKYTEKLAGQDDKIAQLKEAVDKVVKDTVRQAHYRGQQAPRWPWLGRHSASRSGRRFAPKVHGSGLFTRGQTQVMTIVTLGLPNEAQTLDDWRKRKSATCTSTTSRLTAWVRRGRCAAPAGARSATALLPSELCARLSHPMIQISLTPCWSPAKLLNSTARHRWFHLRSYPRPDGRGRSDQGPGCRHRHGISKARRQRRKRLGPEIRCSYRHPRHGRLLRRYGLQGRGNAKRNHRPTA